MAPVLSYNSKDFGHLRYDRGFLPHLAPSGVNVTCKLTSPVNMIQMKKNEPNRGPSRSGDGYKIDEGDIAIADDDFLRKTIRLIELWRNGVVFYVFDDCESLWSSK